MDYKKPKQFHLCHANNKAALNSLKTQRYYSLQTEVLLFNLLYNYIIIHIQANLVMIHNKMSCFIISRLSQKELLHVKHSS